MLLYVVLFVAALCALYSFRGSRRHGLEHIPTVGYESGLLYYLSAIRYLFNARDIIEEGYRLYPGHAFKVPMLDGWNVVLNGSNHVEDLKKVTDDNLCAFASTREFFQFDLTLGPRVSDNRYHFSVIRTVMTRNIGPRFTDIHEAVVNAFEDQLAGIGSDWAKIQAFPFHVDIISKVTSRFFVGYPLCDNAEFRSICEAATGEIFKGRALRAFPTLLRPFASRLVTGIHSLRARMEILLRPIIEERLDQEKRHGVDWDQKPNDLLTWLIDGARATGEEVSVEDISSRMLFVSFGAIHTSSMTFTSALYQLCMSPSDVKILRDEAEAAVREEGWTKEALAKMVKMDSYIRESSRVHPMSLISVGRTAMSDFTFSDGLFVPKGTKICVNTHGRHFDEGLYPDPYAFDGFRFLNKDDPDSQPPAVLPTVDYHAFGYGRPACPGRFFAIVELKLMMAHLLINYDFKLQTGAYPSKLCFETIVVPSRTESILYRKRQN